MSLASRQERSDPRGGFAGFMQRYETKRTQENHEKVKETLKGYCTMALEKPTQSMQTFFEQNPYVPIYVRYALHDILSPDTQGHIDIQFTKQKDEPMFITGIFPYHENSGEQSTIVRILINTAHPLTKVWLHTRGPAEDLIQEGFRALTDSALLLSEELLKDPSKILHRSDFPVKK